MHKNPKRYLRIAILHDDFSICGGGEKLVAILAKELTKKGMKVDIITYDISEETKKMIPKEIKIKTILDKKYPFQDDIVKRYSFFKLNLTKNYDLFIFSGHSSLCAAKINKPNILYCHNIRRPESLMEKKFEEKPDRHAQAQLSLIDNSIIEKSWAVLCKIKNCFIKKQIPRKISKKIDLARFFFTISPHISSLKYALKIPTEKLSKKIDLARFFFTISPHTSSLEYALKIPTEKQGIKNELKYVQKVITNSLNIKKKVKQFYNKDSSIIYPPIETKKFHYRKHKNFWVSVNRVDPYNKRLELQLKAFSKMPNEKLYIIGHIQNQNYYEFLKKIKPSNVKFFGVINEKELIKKLSECKGMVFTAEDEDFGMAPVEAMASGKPVIAPNEGGCKETIINGKTGILINNINEDKIVRSVEKINKNPERYKNACLRQARKFDVEVFIKKMTEEIKDSLVQ